MKIEASIDILSDADADDADADCDDTVAARDGNRSQGSN